MKTGKILECENIYKFLSTILFSEYTHTEYTNKYDNDVILWG
jgi:hypothetical protein